MYECTDCLEHHTSVASLTACPACGGRVENLTKDRAE
nr:rubrerythrin-like domain-containing protein [Halolamina pelagica]